MNLALDCYRWLIRGLVEILESFPPRRVDQEEIELRKGGYVPTEPVGDRLVWVHGASLGEVITLRPLLRRLNARLGRENLLITTTTMDGLRQARKENLAAHTTLLPLELPEVFNPFVKRFGVRLLLINETELWPLMLANLQHLGIPFGLINARINPRTVRLLNLVRPLFSQGLSGLRFVFAQTREYESRFRKLAIPRHTLSVLGSYKYDIDVPPFKPESLRRCYGVPPGRKIFCCGSTHADEEEQILRAMDPLWQEPGMTLILAPRHLQRVAEVEALLKARNLDYCRLSQLQRPLRQVLLVDQLGQLQKLYAIADLAFVGGSLIPRGGHNLLEPAAFGVPILTGPHTFNFKAESEALRKADGMREVSDFSQLQAALREFRESPLPFQHMGKRGQTVLSKLSGAVDQTLSTLEQAGLLP